MSAIDPITLVVIQNGLQQVCNPFRGILLSAGATHLNVRYAHVSLPRKLLHD